MKIYMNNTNQILEFLKAELNSIASNDISIEDSNRIASELLKKCNDIKTCLHFLSLLKSNSKKTLSFKKFASAYLKNIYQGTPTPTTKSQVIDTNPESSNYNKASINKAWRKFGEEEFNQDNQNEKLTRQYKENVKLRKLKFIYVDNYGSSFFWWHRKKNLYNGGIKGLVVCSWGVFVRYIYWLFNCKGLSKFTRPLEFNRHFD